jgi:K+-transporting ATPase KdpF subunit
MHFALCFSLPSLAVRGSWWKGWLADVPTLYIAGGAIALALLIYLFVALLNPERFS